MKGILNFILALASLVYLALFVIMQLAVLGVIQTDIFLGDFMSYVMTYAPLILLSLFALVDFSTKSIKILFLIILIIVIIAGVLVIGFPSIFAEVPATLLP